MTLEQVNDLNQDDFVSVLGSIFEHSPWVAARAYRRRPFASLEALHEAMTDEMYAAPPADQLHLLRAHPDLAGKAAVRGELTQSSRREQVGAGLDQCSPDELELIQELNTKYASKFGFPFIMAVKGCTRADVIGQLTQRLGRSPPQEREEALAQVARIAWYRLTAAVGSG